MNSMGKRNSNGAWRSQEAPMRQSVNRRLHVDCHFSMVREEMQGLPSAEPRQAKIKKQEMASLEVGENRTVWLE